MSSEKVAQKARQTLKGVKELLEKAEETTGKVLEKAAPALQRSVDTSMEAAASGFNATMKSIEGATAGDQVKLLNAYKKFLAGQMEFVDARVRDLEKPRSQSP